MGKKSDKDHEVVAYEEGATDPSQSSEPPTDGEKDLDDGDDISSGEGSAEQDEEDFAFFEDESEGEEASEVENVTGFDESTLESAIGEESMPIEDEEFEDLEAEEFGQESVCGRDDRVRITGTTRLPWRWNCQILMTFKNGRRSRCTGWLIGPRTVMTAGHCVYSRGNGGWAKSIEVVPGMNGSSRPYGSLVSRSFRSVKGWTNSGKSTHDYGAIILPNCRFKNLGYFGFASLSANRLKNLLVNNAGYAGDKPFGTLWFNAGRIKNVTSRRLYYMLDTYGGHSGSAVWWLTKRNGRYQRYSVGVHGYGGCPNKAVRIVKPVFDNMSKWKHEGRC